MKRLMTSLVLTLATAAFVRAETLNLDINFTGGKEGNSSTPVCVPLSVPPALAKATLATVQIGGGKSASGQLTDPGLTTEAIAPSQKGLVRRDLHVIVPGLKAGESVSGAVEINDIAKAGALYHWEHKKGEYAELVHGMNNRPVLRYICAPLDESTKDRRTETYKVFHHLYDAAGTRFVTNPGVTGLYPHHRGMMLGFNKISYGNNKKADTWHCTGKAHQEHAKFLSEEAGPLLGRHRVLVTWHGQDGEVIGNEEREFTVYNTPGGQFVEFASRLKTTVGPLKLDGDPQHAGFQFRAHRDVAEKTAKQTYYVRTDGQGKPGETRNWPANKEQTNLPWNAMSFVLDGKRYTAAYLDQPKNPHPTFHSERDYGRFGCYFVYDVTESNPLQLNYRIWLQDGEMTVADIQMLSANFATPPTAKVQ